MPTPDTIIDATGQSLGRVASRAAHYLRGKASPTFSPQALASVKVRIENARKLRFTGKKFDANNYYRFSGYPGGLKTTKLRDLFEKSPETVVRMAVKGMLPANKLRARLLKHLTITE